MTEQRALRILVVDDEVALARTLELNLKARGYTPVIGHTGAEALRAAADEHVDAIILDLGLPDIDGQDVIAGIRGWSDVPILVLSARQTPDDKVDALDAGADDYVTKPFEMRELLARLRAALRRGATDAADPVVTAGPLMIDLARSVVTRNGESVRLTPTEWRLLEVLARHPDALVAQRTLLREVWGPAYDHETNYLRVYMATLRRKLEAEPSAPKHLLTEPGLGYRLATS